MSNKHTCRREAESDLWWVVAYMYVQLWVGFLLYPCMTLTYGGARPLTLHSLELARK